MRIILSIKKFVILSTYIMEKKRGKGLKSLSEQQILEICQKLLNPDLSRVKIAAEYGIKQKIVLRIKRSEMFKAVKEQGVYVKGKEIIYPNLEKQLHDWCVERTAPDDKIRINWKLLKEKALELINNIGGPLHLKTQWLDKFVKRHNIQVENKLSRKYQYRFLKFRFTKYKEVDEQLLNWLLEVMILGDKISFDSLTDKTKQLIYEFNEFSNDDALYKWLWRFRKCHDILINSVILKNLKKGDDETDKGQLATHLEETNLEEQDIEFKQYNYEQYTSSEKQLVNWLLKQKKSGVTISHAMLRDETLKLIIDEFNGSLKKIKEGNWLWKIGLRYFLLTSYTFEMLKCQIQQIKENCEREQSELKKFFYKLKQIEKENINKNNIYSMIKTDVSWKSDTRILETLERKETKEEIVKQTIDIAKLKNSVTAIFCTNVTGSHILPPITGELTLEGDVATKESKEFAFWYNNLFKKSVREHQLKENITGKVLLLAENWTRHISEEIMRDDDVEILILPINIVSFFQLLYPEFCKEFYKMFDDDMFKRIDESTNSHNCKEYLIKDINRSYDINFYEDTICKSWFLMKTENIEESWRKFLEYGHQTQEDMILSTAQLVNHLIKVHS